MTNHNYSYIKGNSNLLLRTHENPLQMQNFENCGLHRAMQTTNSTITIHQR